MAIGPIINRLKEKRKNTIFLFHSGLKCFGLDRAEEAVKITEQRTGSGKVQS